MPDTPLTARQQEAQTAQAALVYAESIIETVREPLLVLDENLYVVSANRAYHHTFGEPPTKTNNRLLYELGDRQWDTPELRRLLGDLVLHRAEFHDLVMVHSFPGIGTRTMRLNARPLRRPEDAPHIGSNRTGMLLLAIEDMTVQQRTAEALQRSETRYRRLFEAARDGILLLEADSGMITDANPYFAALLEYTRDELLGKELWQLGLFADRAASQAAFRHLQEQEYIRYENLPLQTRGGKRREVEFVSNVYTEGDQRVIQCNVRDITERKQAENTLQRLLRREQHIAQTLQKPLTVGIAEDAFPGLAIASFYEAASDEALIGGDFFDAFALPGERIALAVADTSGKGLVAAARTMQIKDVLRAFARESLVSAAEVVARLNRFACGTRRFDNQDDEMFTSLVLVFLDPLTGEGEIVSAGCEPPILLRAAGRSEVEYVPQTDACLPLGITPEEVYSAVPLQLAVGDTLLLMTDGITEAHPPKIERRQGHVFLGSEGALALAQQVPSTRTLAELGRAILEGARAFTGGALHDDACLLLARRPPTP